MHMSDSEGHAPERARERRRFLAESSPELEALELAHRPEDPPAVHARVERIVRCAMRLSSCVARHPRVAVVGCGPTPAALDVLGAMGLDAVGIEPVSAFVERWRATGRPGTVLHGAAEALPLADGSVGLVLMENVLEHVDSADQALAECHRVLAPGGVLFIKTTNRLMVTNDEYTVPLFQWLPALLRECVIHQQQRYDPSLARFTTRPAVHWFTYAGLCRLGRSAGFYRFFSLTDALRIDDPEIDGHPLRGRILGAVQRRPLVRCLALTQLPGSTVFMVRR